METEQEIIPLDPRISNLIEHYYLQHIVNEAVKNQEGILITDNIDVAPITAHFKALAEVEPFSNHAQVQYIITNIHERANQAKPTE